MHDFKELRVWRKGMTLALEVFALTDGFPASQRYGLASQIERSAVSIPSNIAEGSGRSSDKDFVRFLHIAYGSACELETQLILAHDLGYLSTQDREASAGETVEIRRMLFALCRVLSDKATPLSE